MRRTLRLVAVALMVGLAAVTVGVQPAGADRPRHDVIEGLFDVGGYRLYLRCTGRGNPTVVMDASAGEDSSTWSDVEPSLARVTRVCVYDRARLGRSDPGADSPHEPDDGRRPHHPAATSPASQDRTYSWATRSPASTCRYSRGKMAATRWSVSCSSTPPRPTSSPCSKASTTRSLLRRTPKTTPTEWTSRPAPRKPWRPGRSRPYLSPCSPTAPPGTWGRPGGTLAGDASGAVTALAQGAPHRRPQVRSLHPERSAEARRSGHRAGRRQGPAQRCSRPRRQRRRLTGAGEINLVPAVQALIAPGGWTHLRIEHGGIVETVSDTESWVALVTGPLGPSRTNADWPRRFS